MIWSPPPDPPDPAHFARNLSHSQATIIKLRMVRYCDRFASQFHQSWRPKRRDTGRPTMNITEVLIGWNYHLASRDYAPPFLNLTSSQITLTSKNAAIWSVAVREPTTGKAQLASCKILLFGIPDKRSALGYACQQVVIPFGLACPGPADDCTSYSDALLVDSPLVLR